MAPTNDSTITIRLSSAVIADLERLAKERGITKSRLVRLMLISGVASQKRRR